MPWHAGILELWHTIKSEGILDLRNGVRRVELVWKDMLHDLNVKIRDFRNFETGFSGNSGIPGVLKSSLSDSPRSITYNYALTL